MLLLSQHAMACKDVNGAEYLKLRPTSPPIVKLVCGKCEKNSSLSNGQCLKALKEKRDAEVAASMAQSREQGSKKRKAESIVDIDVCGTMVNVLCPPKRVSHADLMVCLGAKQLEAVLTFLQPDCEQLNSKREYKRTGRFKKNHQSEQEASEESDEAS